MVAIVGHAFEFALVRAGKKKFEQILGIGQGLNLAVGAIALAGNRNVSLLLQRFSWFPKKVLRARWLDDTVT